MLDLRGPPVFVYAEESDVQVMAREGEVVVIAAEIGYLLFDRKDQPHVGVPFEAVEPVFAAVIKRNDLTLQTCFRRFLFFNRGHLGLALLGGFFVRGFRFDCALYALRHVLVRDHHVDFEVGAFQLLFASGGVKTLFDEVASARREFRYLPRAYVLVGEDQAVSRNEGSGPSARALAQAHGGQPRVIEPFARWLEAVLLLPLLERRVVESPHPFVGEPRGDEDQTGCDENNDGKLFHRLAPNQYRER